MNNQMIIMAATNNQILSLTIAAPQIKNQTKHLTNKRMISNLIINNIRMNNNPLGLPLINGFVSPNGNNGNFLFKLHRLTLE